jgi:peptidoglycan/LPS O-acetylase OafA/YrhL
VTTATAPADFAADSAAASRATLEPAFSLYLDLVRGCAALAVVVSHFAYFDVFDDAQIARLPDFGREAVIAFFVLSGFVVSHSARHRNHTLADYAAARCARVYSVALPMLLLAFAVAAAVQGFGLGPVKGGYQLHKPWLYLPFHLLFMGELWGFVEQPPWLVPYWSLNYEVWYYVLFGAACYLRGGRRVVACTLILALAGPRLWLLLPVWLSGVALYHWHGRFAPGPGVARAGWLCTVLAIGAWGWFDPEPQLRVLAQSAWPFAGIRMGSADRVLADYAVALLVVANFVCARAAGFAGLARVAGPVRRMAGLTYPLYLSHALVICLWQTLVPAARGAPGTIAGLALAIAATALAFDPLAGRLHGLMRRRLAGLLNRTAAAAAPASPRL